MSNEESGIKERVKQKYTTIIGAVIMLAGLGLFIGANFADYEFSVYKLAATLVVGWVFLFAKDTLLEGVFLNTFKIKK